MSGIPGVHSPGGNIRLAQYWPRTDCRSHSTEHIYWANCVFSSGKCTAGIPDVTEYGPFYLSGRRKDCSLLSSNWMWIFGIFECPQPSSATKLLARQSS